MSENSPGRVAYEAFKQDLNHRRPNMRLVKWDSGLMDDYWPHWDVAANAGREPLLAEIAKLKADLAAVTADKEALVKRFVSDILGEISMTSETQKAHSVYEVLPGMQDWDALMNKLCKESTDMSTATVDCLNAAFKADPNAIHSLLVNRVPCNKALADDPFVIVDKSPVLDRECLQVGALGLLNGVLAANGEPLIGVMWSERDTDGRSKMMGFCELPKQAGTQVS